MEKNLYGLVVLPQGVEHVTLAVNNMLDVLEAIHNDADRHYYELGFIVGKYAGTRTIPQRVSTDGQNCVFEFAGFARDMFGNVRAYYHFVKVESIDREDGTITRNNSPKNDGGNGTAQ